MEMCRRVTESERVRRRGLQRRGRYGGGGKGENKTGTETVAAAMGGKRKLGVGRRLLFVCLFFFF